MKAILQYIIITTLTINFISASDMRVAALGGNAGFWPEDDQNILLFPSTMNNFNLAQIQGVSGDGGEDGYERDGHSSTQSATFLFGEGTKYGFLMTGNDDLVNIGVARDNWGAYLGVDLDSDEAPGESGTINSSETNLNAGFGMELGFGELGVSLATSSSDDGDGDSNNDPSGMGLGANVRMELGVWEFSHLLASFGMASSETGSATASDMAASVSLFRHWNLNTDTDLLFAVGFGFETSTSNGGMEGENDLTETAITLPNYTFAVETNLLDWATARAGYTSMHLLTGSTDDGTTKASSMGDGMSSTVFGLGLEYGGFTLDVDLNPGFFTNPVSYITGNNLMSPLASQATITYTF